MEHDPPLSKKGPPYAIQKKENAKKIQTWKMKSTTITKYILLRTQQTVMK